MADTQATAATPSELDTQISRFKTDMGLVHQLVHGDNTTDVVTEGGPVPTFAKIASQVANSLIATSTSHVEAKLGEMVFEIQAGKNFGPGQWIVAESGVELELTGNIVSYAGTTLIVNVTRLDGEPGFYSQWNLGISGPMGVQGLRGLEGKSAYQVALDDGYSGTRAEWVASLKGADGDPGDDAYEVAVLAGFPGTREEWLESLIGPPGKGEPGDRGPSAYEEALERGDFEGTYEMWLESLRGAEGPLPSRLPYDLTYSAFEQLAPGVTIGATVLARELELLAGLPGSQAYCDNPPAASPTRFDLSVNNSVIASVTFVPGNNWGTWEMAEEHICQIGDVVRLRSAGSGDFDTSILGVQLTVMATAMLAQLG